MSPEVPSLSMVVYYQDMLRFYEYRITQTTDSRDLGAGSTVVPGWDKRIKHEIWKWDGTLTPKLLASVVRTATAADGNWDVNLLTVNVSTYPTEFHVYNSSSTATSLKVKFYQTDITGWTLFNGATAVVNVVTDPISPIQSGSYGFHSADCAIWVDTMTINDLGSSGGEFLTPPTSVIGTASEWFLMPNVYKTTTPGFISESLSAQVKVLTGTTETGPWTPFATHAVTTYAYQNFSATTNDWRNLCARIEVDDTDNIVADGIHVTSWRALSSITRSPTDGWKITEGWVSSNATDRTYAHLDSSQADPVLVQGVCSTQLMGLGSIAFDYRVTAMPTKLKIQYTASASPAYSSPTLNWVDVTNFTFAATSGWVNINLFLGVAPATNIYVRIINDLTYSNKGVIDLKNITIWNNPTNSPCDWTAYNMKITKTDTNKWWLDSDRSGYLNNGMTNNTIAGRPQDQFEPYIMAPRLTHGLGNLSFLARAFTTNYVPGATNTSISIFVTTDPWDKYKPDYGTNGWTKVYTFTNITNAFYRPFVYSHPILPNDIKAVKLVVQGVRPLVGTPQRVCIDEIIVTDSIYPSPTIENVKLLRKEAGYPVETLQPFEGEDIGIEAQLTNIPEDVQDVQMWVTYVTGTNTWGVFNAPVSNRVTKALNLVDATNCIYRTTGDFAVEGINAKDKYSVVQYIVWVEYDLNGYHQVFQTLSSYPMHSPQWYPKNLNETFSPKWTPYYIVAATNSPLWITPSVQNVAYTGGVFNVFVGALSNWVVSTSDSWITPVQEFGESATRVSYRVTSNANKSDRSGMLTFGCGNLIESIIVHQEPAPTDFSNALGIEDLEWSMGGDQLWFEQTNVFKSGSSALQSGIISHGQNSWVETTVLGPALLSFWWRTSSEAGNDILTLSVNSAPVKSLSGYTEWIQETVTLDSGTNLLRWTYSKDATGSGGLDCAWLDELAWQTTLKIKVFFDTQQGELESTNEVEYTWCSQYSYLPTPTRVGYTFNGWYTTADGSGNQITSTSIVSAPNHTLFARWMVDQNPISYTNTKGVYNSNPAFYTITNSLTFAPLSDVAGYAFVYWSPAGITLGTTGSVTATANWTVKTFNINYANIKGALNTNRTTYTTQDAFVFAPLADLPGYIFKNWSFAGVTNGMSGDLTVTASWTNKSFVVTLDPQGGNVTPTSIAVRYEAPYSGLPTPTFENALFSGWWTEPNGKGTNINIFAVVLVTSNHTLYAKWDINSVVGTTGLAWRTGDNDFWFPQNAITNDGLLAMQSGHITDNESSWIETTITGPCVLRFRWKVDSEDGCDQLSVRVAGEVKDAISGKDLPWKTKELVVPTGEQVIRWEYTKDSSDAVGLDCGWLDHVEIIHTSVFFDAQGGFVNPTNKFVIYGSAYGELPVASFANATMDGWWTLPNGKGSQVTSNTLVTTYDDFSLFAKWNINSVLGTSKWVWSTDGTDGAFWFPESAIHHTDQPLAMQAGAISHNSSTWIETSITNAGTLSFRWAISAELNKDVMICTTNGVPFKTLSSKTLNWTQESIAISNTPMTIRWTFSKDASINIGSNSAWLAAFTWVPDVSSTGFALWSSLHGLSGNLTNLFLMDYNSDNIANGFDYAFGTNLIPDSCLLNIRIISDKAVIEIPKQETGTLPYVDVRVKGSTNLYDWGLSLIPATNTIGMPPNKTWHQLPGESLNKAFFRLEAELK
jgi:uncharacterized repeat protein (TIGR02543 family)